MTIATIDIKQVSRTTARLGSRSSFFRTLRSLVALGCALIAARAAAAQTPAVGGHAPDVTLQTPTGSSVTLANERAKGTTILVVLRGFPGYQCPYCEKQVHDFVESVSLLPHAPRLAGASQLQEILIKVESSTKSRRLYKLEETPQWVSWITR